MERICLVLIVVCLSIMYLPLTWLQASDWQLGLIIVLSVCTVVCWWKKKTQLALIGVAIVISGVWSVINIKGLVIQTQQVPVYFANTKPVIIKIEKVLHQGDYQTAIALLQTAEVAEQYRFYLTWLPKQPLQSGQIWQGEIKLKPFTSRLNQGGFQRQKWFYANRIVGTANVKQARLLSDQPNLRQYLLRFAQRQLKEQPSTGLLLALGFAEKYYLTQEQLKLFQQTGTAHLIAISGLHIGLVFFFGLLVGRGIQYLLPTRKITPILPLLCGGVLAIFYSYLADFSIPTTRAAIGLILLLLLRFRRCHLTWWQLYLRCLALFIIFDPIILLSDSFWLSASAVFCLLVWNELLPLSVWQWRGKPLSQLGKVPYYLLGLLHIQIGLSLLFTPITLLFFHGINLQNILINLWIVPLFSLLLIPCILLSIITFNGLGSWQWCVTIATKSLEWLMPWQTTWREFSLSESLWMRLICLCMVLIIGWYVYYQKRHSNKNSVLLAQLQTQIISFNREQLPDIKRLHYLIISVIVGLIWQLMLLGHHYYQHWQTRWSLEMLDVGQGLSVLIRQGDKGVLYDTGASWQGGSMAELEILPYLQRQGIKLEKIILSHDDNDHSGGATKLLMHYPKAELYTPSQVTYANHSPLPCMRGKEMQWRTLRISMLAPEQIVAQARNQHTCVLLIEGGQYQVLLTGDLDRKSELRYLSLLPKVDIVQIAHHGSKTSTSQPFLQQIDAKIALISSGLGNRWRFPHSEVLERLAMQKMQILNTGWDGQIRLRFMRNNELIITTERHQSTVWFNQLDEVGGWRNSRLKVE